MAKPEPVDSSTDPSSIGHILKRFGVTPEDIVRALEHMGEASDRKLGETLVELGVIKPEELEVALARQRLTRHTNGKKRKGTHSDISKILDFAVERVRSSASENIQNITGQFWKNGAK